MIQLTNRMKKKKKNIKRNGEREREKIALLFPVTYQHLATSLLACFTTTIFTCKSHTTAIGAYTLDSRPLLLHYILIYEIVVTLDEVN